MTPHVGHRFGKKRCPFVGFLTSVSALIGCPLLLFHGAPLGQATAQVAPRVTNGAEPVHGGQRVVLREAWRHGGEDDEVFFGIVDQVLAGPDGRIYILDTQLMTTFVFTPDGEARGSLGRRGEGPGEVSNLNGIFFLPDGTLGLCQALPGRVVQLDLAGNPAGGFVPDAVTVNGPRVC